jgi:hypothetical protein
MAITSSELERDFLLRLESHTGKSVQQWLEILRQSGCQSRQDLLQFLKKHHDWKYLPAQLLVGIFLNQGRRVYGNRKGINMDELEY